MIIPSSGAIFGNGQMGSICDNCNITFMTETGDLEANIVFIMKKDLISGKTFKFQFREVPMIPFVVK